MITKEEFIDLIKTEYPLNYNEIIDNMKLKRSNSFRINTLKTDIDYVLKELDRLGIKYNNIPISNVSYTIDLELKDIMSLDLYKNGFIYLQSISSQVPPLFMDLDENIDILDMCAAPGGKTSMIAQLTKNKANIMACEEDKIRYERLKHNLLILGCKNINVMKQNSKKLDSFFRFDSILLDAPCSGAGTINIESEKDLSYFSKLLVKNSSKLQRDLLKKALEIIKPGKSIIYSTCSILKEENEDVLKSVLNNNFKIEKIELNIDKSNLLPSTIDGVITIKPSSLFEGFFIAKIRRVR